MTDTLSREVLAEVDRLGGMLGTSVVSDELVRAHLVPPPLMQLFAITWPAQYAADEGGPYFWARDVYFHAPTYCDRIDFGFADRGDKELVRFCHARRMYFIMLDLNDATPADPLVYHASSGAYVPLLGSGVPLSAFLRALTSR